MEDLQGSTIVGWDEVGKHDILTFLPLKQYFKYFLGVLTLYCKYTLLC